MIMNNGKQNGLSPVPQPQATNSTEIPEAYLTYAKWLLNNPQVIEVWGMVSHLPEIRTAETAVALDSGVWFLCRVSLLPSPLGAPTAPETMPHLDETIISFVQKE